MLVKILSVVHNDKLHLFQLVNSVGVACHRTSSLTLGYFKDKLSELVMAIVVVTTKTDIFTAFQRVNLWVCYATSNELIWLLSWTSDLDVGSFIETLHWLPLLKVSEFAYWALSRAVEIVEICSWTRIEFEQILLSGYTSFPLLHPHLDFDKLVQMFFRKLILHLTLVFFLILDTNAKFIASKFFARIMVSELGTGSDQESTGVAL